MSKKKRNISGELDFIGKKTKEQTLVRRQLNKLTSLKRLILERRNMKNLTIS